MTNKKQLSKHTYVSKADHTVVITEKKIKKQKKDNRFAAFYGNVQACKDYIKKVFPKRFNTKNYLQPEIISGWFVS